MNARVLESLGPTFKTVVGAFSSEIQSNREAAIEMIKTYESNESTYRRMIEDKSYSFEQKREIREWIEHEKACQKQIDADKRRHDNKHLAVGVALDAFALISFAAITNPRCTEGIAKTFSAFLPKATKLLKNV